MGSVNKFLKKNKIQKENAKFAATKSLVDEKGQPMLWTLRPLSTDETEKLREACTTEVSVSSGNRKGRRSGAYRPKLDSGKYMKKLVAISVVEPDLYSAELQDSYGVKTPEDLLSAMVDEPGEFAELAAFVQEYNGYTDTFEDQVEEVKND